MAWIARPFENESRTRKVGLEELILSDLVNDMQ